jgi:hypothetical protein
MNHVRIASISAAIAMLMFASAATAASKGKAKCFSDGTSACVVSRDVVNLTVYSGGFAGLYLNRKPDPRRNLASQVFAFTANGSVAGGAPRLSIPINLSGVGGTVDGYAFLDVAGCGGQASNPATVSTSDANCHVNFMNVDYDNWAELAASFPNARVSLGGIPFIVADQPGSYSIYNIDLR